VLIHKRTPPLPRRIWRFPLVSWTTSQARRQGERAACNALDFFLSIYLTKYALIGGILLQATLTASTPIDSFLTLSEIFLILTANSLVFVALWWFWPLIAWPWRTTTFPWMHAYPSPPRTWPARVLWMCLLATILTLLLTFSAPFALVVSLSYLGSWLIITGIRRRVGHDERCRCGYPVSTPRWSRGPCPECGRNLDRPRAIILGQDQRSPVRITLGTLGLLISQALLYFN
jgi:hypothetical protein